MEEDTKFLGAKQRRDKKKRASSNKNTSQEARSAKIIEQESAMFSMTSFHFLNDTISANPNNNRNIQIVTNEINEKDISDLKYELDSWSSYISHFHPKNVLKDITPGGLLSKWSVDFKSQNEYLILKLEKTSIVHMITFGKFRDPTNLKEFKIFAGLDKTNMIEILHSGLRNDGEYEPFTVSYKWNNTLIPSNYIKLVPIRPWDDNYNVSVWFINLKGIDNETIINKCLTEYTSKKELESKKLWLRLSRQFFKGKGAEILKISREFESVIRSIEHPLCTDFYQFIVSGNYEKSVDVLNNFYEKGFFDDYVRHLPYKISWNKLDFLDKEIHSSIKNISYSMKLDKVLKRNLFYLDSNNLIENEKNNIKAKQNDVDEGKNQGGMEGLNDDDLDLELELESGMSDCLNFQMEGLESSLTDHFDKIFTDEKDIQDFIYSMNLYYPCSRGGHSMVLDEETGYIYLFGGWDGTKDLDDFWLYDISTNSWKILSTNVQMDGGPSARSCHKMIYDNFKKRILLYGKFDPANESSSEGHLYEYDISLAKWRKIVINREIRSGILIESSGPGQLFDHQMAFDSSNQILYIFGGIKIPDNESDIGGRYLGLWKLDLKYLHWENLLNETPKDAYNIKLRTRSGHSMLYDPVNNELIIIGGSKGQKKKTQMPLFDMMIFNINTKSIKEVFHDFSKHKSAPNVNYSLAAYLNAIKREIYLFGGYTKNDKSDLLSNGFWVYNLVTSTWRRAERSETSLSFDNISLSQNAYNDQSLYLLSLSDFISRKGYFKLTQNSSDDFNGLYYNNTNSNYDTFNEPQPRYAHCLVYSTKLNKGFIFGGNPNIKTSNAGRLNDFWSFDLQKMSTSDIKAQLSYKIYKCYFLELCYLKKFDIAIDVLNKNIQSIIKSHDLFDMNEFTGLTRYLIYFDENFAGIGSIDNEKLLEERIKIYEEIIHYISDCN